jgi:hypothetical protein
MSAPYLYAALGGFFGGVAFGRHWSLLVAGALICLAAVFISRGLVLFCPIAWLNDNGTHDDVLALYDRAIELAEAEA